MNKATGIDPPIVQGGPDPDPDIVAAAYSDPIWVALGQPKPQRIIVSSQGDWWDVIAMRAYGNKRGNEHLMFRLLESNYALRDVAQFPAGIPVIVPDVAVETEIPLVPWTSASFIPSP